MILERMTDQLNIFTYKELPRISEIDLPNRVDQIEIQELNITKDLLQEYFYINTNHYTDYSLKIPKETNSYYIILRFQESNKYFEIMSANLDLISEIHRKFLEIKDKKENTFLKLFPEYKL